MTSDDIRLDGLLMRPRQAASGPVDALLLIHGTGSHCLAPGILEFLADRASSQGTAVLRINTRGHDLVCSLGGGRLGGAAYERVSDAPRDVAAWLNWLAEHGLPRVALVGHSMGAVKVILAAAQPAGEAPMPVAVAALNPPRFCHTSFLAHANGRAFVEEYETARQLAAAGQGEQLLQTRWPLPLLIAAEGYVEKYGPEDRYDFLQWLGEGLPPTLIAIGGDCVARSMAFHQTPAALAKVADRCPGLQVAEIGGANINFRGREDELWQQLAAWLQKLPS